MSAVITPALITGKRISFSAILALTDFRATCVLRSAGTWVCGHL
jgi:hypothetical protein